MLDRSIASVKRHRGSTAVITPLRCCLIVALGGGLLHGSAHEQEAATPPRLQRFMAMAGCWHIEGREMNSRAGAFRQTGVGRVWVQDGTRVRLDRRVTVQEASADYAALSGERRYSEVYYESEPGRIVAEEADAADPARTRRTVLLSPAGDAIFSTFLSNSAGTVNTIMWRIAATNRITSETRSRDPHGNGWSDYAQVWTRLPDSDGRCRWQD
jgi:hypothetical protein